LEKLSSSWHYLPLKGPCSKDFFIIRHIGPLGHPYPDFHPLVLPNIFCLLLFFVNLPHLLLHFTLLLFLPCTHSFLPLFFSGTNSYSILKMDFSSTISSFSPFTSNIPDHISCCPIHRTIWLYTFLVILC